MNHKKVKEQFSSLMKYAGITVNGSRPFDIKVHNDALYERVLKHPALGLGESYMDHWWDCLSLDQFIEKILQANLVNKIKQDWITNWNCIKSSFLNLQTAKRAFIIGKQHYDIGNDLYEKMLDKRMQYTCGYWREAETLDAAQEAKLELICRKIALKPGMHVLEFGCGFGGFARYAAENYGARVTGFTVSKQQAEYAKNLCLGLPVNIHLDDYRKASGSYDRVVSIGLMEHVGYKNYRAYMKLASRLLKDDGLAFIHTIGSNASNKICNAWTSKYIFPNSMLPSIAQLGKAMECIFVIEDLHNFGEDYDKTLMAWHQNFKSAWPELREKYGERFYRMWEYYLFSCAGGFRAREMQLWQIVMSKPGRKTPRCRIS